MFQIGDRVQLDPAVGGFEGYVTSVVGGPADRLYLVQARDSTPLLGPRQVNEAQISAGPLSPPVFSVGRNITIDGFGGTIVADNADRTYNVDVTVTDIEHLTYTRRHVVPDWQLALENEEG